MLWLALVCPGDSLSVFSYMCLDKLEKDIQFPMAESMREYSSAGIAQIHERMQCQLVGYTGGLLEMRPTKSFQAYTTKEFQEVSFIHRTLRRYLTQHRLPDLRVEFSSLDSVDTWFRLCMVEQLYFFRNAEPKTLTMARLLDRLSLDVVFSDSCPFARPLTFTSLDMLQQFIFRQPLQFTSRYYPVYRYVHYYNPYGLMTVPSNTRFSILHHVLFYGPLPDDAIEEIIRRRKSKEVPGTMSFLLNAIHKCRWDIAKRLLDHGWSFQDEVEVGFCTVGSNCVPLRDNGYFAWMGRASVETVILLWMMQDLIHGKDYENKKLGAPRWHEAIEFMLKRGSKLPQLVELAVNPETPDRDGVARNQATQYWEGSLELCLRTLEPENLGCLLSLMGVDASDTSSTWTDDDESRLSMMEILGREGSLYQVRLDDRRYPTRIGSICYNETLFRWA
jgi:hypothetical protein